MTTHTEEDFLAAPDERSLDMSATMRDVAVVTVINVPLQLIATDLGLSEVVAGLAALYVLCLVGVALARYLPFYLPSVAWISLAGIVATLPMLPWGEWFTGLVGDLDFLAMAVPALAYAGLAVSKMEIGIMRRSGWKILIIAILVFLGTYLGSAVIAHFSLGWTS